ncbi:MAG TPA: DUF882 domain-containing protein [Stellaceae bacterium]|nr:DUF882 domain-containing protein [Stellaceae bacterium]
MPSAPELGRRRFLVQGAAASLCFLAAPAIATPRAPLRRVVAFDHLHTGERLDIVYWADGHYQPGALRRINWLLRDFRNDAVHPIDPHLIDLLAVLRQRLGAHAPIQVLSAYRSPATNAMLASMSEGVATNSLHLQGRAIDIRLPGRPLSAVRRAALVLRGGGVGYYPRSNFVHLDVGSVRRW